MNTIHEQGEFRYTNDFCNRSVCPYQREQSDHRRNFWEYKREANYIDHRGDCLVSVSHVNTVFRLSLTRLRVGCTDTHSMNEGGNLREVG